MARPIPATIEDCTADWLTEALRSRRAVSEDAVITDRTVEILGTGQGFAGELARLTLSYGSGSGPETMVAKIPTSIEDNRNGSELLGVYERELRMYEEILPGLDAEIPRPRLYYSDIEVNPDAEKQLDRIRRIDRLPIWMLRVLLWFVNRFAKPDTYPSILLLEDLRPPVTIGDQVTGCDVDHAASALEAIARLHAATWGPRRPEETYWLVSFGVAPRLFRAGTKRAQRGFLKNYGHLLGDHSRRMLKQAQKESVDRTLHLASQPPQCLLHGDFRLDNMFFDADGRVASLIDWQLASFGPAVMDVVYFICGSIAPSVPEAEVDALLGRYHAALTAAGVEDYPLPRLREDYEEALRLLLARMSSVDLLDLGEADGRGADLVEQWLRRLDARVARVAV